jgi:membrane protein implicated in regulation of membrane protease activity
MLDGLFSGNTLFFSVPAIGGTLFFIIRMAMELGGLTDLSDDGNSSLDHSLGDPHHSSELFKFLSVQSIAAFLMGFGWGGLGALRGAGWEFGTALLVAVGGGVFMVWLLTWLLKMVHDLQSSGTVSIQQALGAEGEVYVTVPENGQGTGQVRVIVNNRQRIYNASSEGEALPTNARVRVTRVNDNNTLTVTRA